MKQSEFIFPTLIPENEPDKKNINTIHIQIVNTNDIKLIIIILLLVVILCILILKKN